jgi:ADP-ribose pyrophosphatase YjhB (NUDIX family)
MSDIKLTDEILLAFKKVKSIADIGLLYCKDEYGRERYHELLNIATTSIAALTDKSIGTITDFYDKVTDYPTPKVDVRAFIVNEKNEILLIQERADNCWTLPGGWADIGQTASEAVIREVKEETGLDVEVVRLLAVFDKRKHSHPPQPFYVYKMVFLCQVIGEYKTTTAFDVLNIGTFNVDDLPVLSEDRILASQIETLYRHWAANEVLTIID